VKIIFGIKIGVLRFCAGLKNFFDPKSSLLTLFFPKQSC
jgi:hypothetical protein